MKKIAGVFLGSAVAFMATTVSWAADPVKIGYIDPLSGPFAATGTEGLAGYQFSAEELVNKKGGVLDGQMFEIIPFDNKVSPKEFLSSFR